MATPLRKPGLLQRSFVYSTCFEVLLCGGPDVDTSAALVGLPLRWSMFDDLSALILGRSYIQTLTLAGIAHQVYPRELSECVNSTWGIEYRFPNGGRIAFGPCERDQAHRRYEGVELNILGMANLCNFTEEQYRSLRYRVRQRFAGYPLLVRSTCSGDVPTDSWVYRRWGAWLDPNFEADGLPLKSLREPGPPAMPGDVWWVKSNRDGSEDYESERPEGEGAHLWLSRTLMRAETDPNAAGGEY